MLPPAGANRRHRPTSRRGLDDRPLGQERRSSRTGQASPGRRVRRAAVVLVSRRTSRYSASDSAPVGQGQAEAQQRPGREPPGPGHGQAAAPQRPLPHPGHVPLAGEADLAQLGVAEPDPVTPRRRRPRVAAQGAVLAPAVAAGTATSATGDPVADEQVLARCPGCRRPAARARPPRARARARCRPRSRSRGSSGSPRGRPRPGRPASPATGSPGAARPRCGPRAGPRPRRGGGGPRRRRSSPSAARASSHSDEVEALGPLLEGARRPATPARSPRPSGGRPGWRGPRPTVASGSCQRSGEPPGAPCRRRAAGRPCAAARRRCPGRTTGRGCGAWARTRPTEATTVTDWW